MSDPPKYSDIDRDAPPPYDHSEFIKDKNVEIERLKKEIEALEEENQNSQKLKLHRERYKDIKKYMYNIKSIYSKDVVQYIVDKKYIESNGVEFVLDPYIESFEDNPKLDHSPDLLNAHKRALDKAKEKIIKRKNWLAVLEEAQKKNITDQNIIDRMYKVKSMER